MDDFLSLAAKELERWYWVDMTFRFQYNGWIFRNTGYSVVFQVIRWRRHLYCFTILVMSLVNLSLPYCTHYYQMCICAVLAGYSTGKITLRKWEDYSNEMNNRSSHWLLWNSITTIYKTCMIIRGDYDYCRVPGTPQLSPLEVGKITQILKHKKLRKIEMHQYGQTKGCYRVF